VELWGTGSPFREFLYVDDLADACVFLMEKYDYREIGELINIGTGKDIMIKDLALMVRDIVGFRGEIVWDSTKPDGTPRKLLDISRIRALGWEPKTSLEEGIQKTYEWYLTTVTSNEQ
jgi:GDP-L-fucose synthase